MLNTKIICFGEVLWDILPSGKKAGGAPMNVAYHLQNFGISTSMISSVGKDNLGLELIAFLQQHSLPTDFITQDDTLPTGTVHVQLDENGSPSYEIVSSVAWDNIPLDEARQKAVKEADALVFGSLACRSVGSRETLMSLAQLAPMRIFDLNLRSPFYSQELIEKLLSVANVVKMSDEELEIIGNWYLEDFDVTTVLQLVSKKFGIDTIVLTKGKEGAVCLNEDKMYHQSSFPIKVVDTIGSGDSFLAAFLKKMFNLDDIQSCLEFACAMGGLVASSKGGTPKITEQDVYEFIEKCK
ncbi:MAG: carbohydrate kinase [Chitinophagales bacterium]